MVKCSECRWNDLDIYDEPCNSCEKGNGGDGVKWEPKISIESINEKLDKIMEYLGIKG